MSVSPSNHKLRPDGSYRSVITTSHTYQTTHTCLVITESKQPMAATLSRHFGGMLGLVSEGGLHTEISRAIVPVNLLGCFVQFFHRGLTFQGNVPQECIGNCPGWVSMSPAEIQLWSWVRCGPTSWPHGHGNRF